MLIPRALVGLLVVVACGGACGGGGESAADALVAGTDAPPSERRELQVEAGATLEVVLDMAMGSRVAFELEASATINWNLHHFADGITMVDGEGSGTAVDERFTAPVATLYGIDLENPGAVVVDVTVDLTLGPGATVSEWP